MMYTFIEISPHSRILMYYRITIPFWRSPTPCKLSTVGLCFSINCGFTSDWQWLYFAIGLTTLVLTSPSSTFAAWLHITRPSMFAPSNYSRLVSHINIMRNFSFPTRPSISAPSSIWMGSWCLSTMYSTSTCICFWSSRSRANGYEGVPEQIYLSRRPGVCIQPKVLLYPYQVAQLRLRLGKVYRLGTG